MKLQVRYRPVILLLLLTLGCGGSGRFRSPKVISEMHLDYPLAAQLQKIEGETLVGVFVSADGRAEEVTLVESSGHKELDDAALRFARTLTFQPALLDNKPISAWTRLLLRYRLTEVLFENDRWLVEVQSLHNQAKAEKDSSKREIIFRKLYTNYVGLVNYVDRQEDTEINSTIRAVLTRTVEQQWQPFWDIIPAPFAVFDDFLKRYPRSALTERVKEDLMQQLVETEYRIKIKALGSSRLARKTPVLIQMLESRLEELQKKMEDSGKPSPSM